MQTKTWRLSPVSQQLLQETGAEEVPQARLLICRHLST